MSKHLFDSDKSEDRLKLATSIKQSAQDMVPFLRERNKCLALYRGARWRGNKYAMMARTPIPFMKQALDLYTQYLSGVRPRVLVVADDPRNQSSGDQLQSALNRLQDEIKFGRTRRMLARESLIGFPLLKIAASPLETSSRKHSDLPFVDIIYTPDVVVDMSSDRPDRVGYIGNKYRVALDWVKKNAGSGKLYRKNDVERLVALPGGKTSAGRRSTTETLFQMVELVDLYMPLDNLWITIPSPEYHDANVVLYSEEWNGPSDGPFVPVLLAETQEDVLPVPPAWSWIDGHIASNSLYNKLIDMSQDMKNVIGAQGNAIADAERLVSASHGEIWRFDHPNNVKEFRFGGPDQPVLSFAVHLRSLVSHYAGNVDLLSGGSAQSPTATQDSILAQQGNRALEDMVQIQTDAVSEAIRKLAWYLMNMPGIAMPIKRRIGNVDVASTFDRKMIEGDFVDYDFSVEPYSMKYRGPQERFAQLMAIVNGIVAPFSQNIERQGGMVDIEELLKIAGTYNDLPEVDRIVRRSDMATEQASQDAVSGPANTRRETVRIGVGQSGGLLGGDSLNSLPGLNAADGG